MKTITVKGKKYKEVAEERENSCSGCMLLGKCSDARLRRLQCDIGNFILKKLPKKKSKTNKVEFFRYYRPIDQRTGFVRSDMGVTFYVRLNYKKRTLRVSCAVCKGDNFSKEIGKIQAKTRYDFGRYLEFPLNDYVDFQDTVLDYLRMNLDDECHLPEFEAAVKQLRMRSAR